MKNLTGPLCALSLMVCAGLPVAGCRFERLLVDDDSAGMSYAGNEYPLVLGSRGPDMTERCYDGDDDCTSHICQRTTATCITRDTAFVNRQFDRAVESDVDCGKENPNKCRMGEGCGSGEDCATRFCLYSQCMNRHFAGDMPEITDRDVTIEQTVPSGKQTVRLTIRPFERVEVFFSFRASLSRVRVQMPALGPLCSLFLEEFISRKVLPGTWNWDRDGQPLPGGLHWRCEIPEEEQVWTPFSLKGEYDREFTVGELFFSLLNATAEKHEVRITFDIKPTRKSG